VCQNETIGSTYVSGALCVFIKSGGMSFFSISFLSPLFLCPLITLNVMKNRPDGMCVVLHIGVCEKRKLKNSCLFVCERESLRRRVVETDVE
jgi:hypothetical protein